MKNYRLPSELYRQTLWFVRQYDVKKAEYETLAWSAIEADGQPHGTAPGNPTASRAIRAARLGSHIKAIDIALNSLPEYYRKPVFEHVAYGTRFPELSDRKTYYRYQRIFLYRVALNMEWI